MSRGLRPPIRGKVSFDDVSFNYGTSPIPALDRVSFSIDAGQVVGIVGRSGSGKSTVMRLLQGLYPAQRGLIRIDDHDIRELDKVHLRHHWAWCCRRASCSAAPSATTSRPASPARSSRRSSGPPGRPAPRSSSSGCRRATTRRWRRAAPICRAASAAPGDRPRPGAATVHPAARRGDQRARSGERDDRPGQHGAASSRARPRSSCRTASPRSAIATRSSCSTRRRSSATDPHDILLANCLTYRMLWDKQSRSFR